LFQLENKDLMVVKLTKVLKGVAEIITPILNI